MRQDLIITNGDSTVELMRAANFEAEILPWRDVLHDGPVPDLPSTVFAKVRAEFLTRYGNVSAEAIASDFLDRDEKIATLAAYDSVSLWFEHDLYDQLQVLQVLAQIATCSAQSVPVALRLVQSDTLLCHFTPDTIGDLAAIARPITQADMDYAKSVWNAFTSSTASNLNQWLTAETPLPYVPPALLRLAQEFPDSKTGLTLTETRILTELEQEPNLAGKMFGKISKQETAQFMGDLSFAAILDGLAFCPAPLISGLTGPLLGHIDTYQTYFASGLAISPVGRDVLAGSKNHIALNGIDRWIGGAHLTPSNLWTWNGVQISQTEV